LFVLHGNEAVPASCMQEAREAASVGRFDLLVSDVEFGDGSGLEFMRELKRSRGAMGIATVGDAMERACQEAGFDRFFAKPIQFGSLIAAAEELAGRSR
jgi:CheY-like chemotaxis protein